MSAGTAVTIALTFVWVGLVVGISFIEAPLKFRAPDVTVRIGLGIGRLVFRVVNTVEAVLAVVIAGCVVLAPPPPVPLGATVLAIVVLATQLALVRPRLSRRSNAVLAGEEAPRSRAHHVYVGTELVKLVALLAGGIGLLAAV